MNEIAIKCYRCNVALCRETDIMVESERFYATMPYRLLYYGVNRTNNTLTCINCFRKLGIVMNGVVCFEKIFITRVTININQYIQMGRLRFVPNNQMN